MIVVFIISGRDRIRITINNRSTSTVIIALLNSVVIAIVNNIFIFVIIPFIMVIIIVLIIILKFHSEVSSAVAYIYIYA